MKQRRSWLAVLMLAGSYTSYNIGSAFASGNGVVRIRVRGEHVLGDGADAHVHVLQIGEQILRLHIHQRADDCVVAARAGILAEDQVEARGDTLDLNLARALEAARNALDRLADDIDLLEIHLAEAALR